MQRQYELTSSKTVAKIYFCCRQKNGYCKFMSNHIKLVWFKRQINFDKRQVLQIQRQLNDKMAITGTLGGEDARFGILDYLVLGLTLCVSSGIGIYYRFTGGKQKTAEEYLLGDKKMSVVRYWFYLEPK